MSGVQTELIDLGFRPRAWQTRVLKSSSGSPSSSCIAAAGKTVLAVMRLIDAALRLELPMGHYGYLAPQLKQAKRIAWRYLKFYGKRFPARRSINRNSRSSFRTAP
jgi:hypothetical protein